jgi:hypothetical protein
LSSAAGVYLITPAYFFTVAPDARARIRRYLNRHMSIDDATNLSHRLFGSLGPRAVETPTLIKAMTMVGPGISDLVFSPRK